MKYRHLALIALASFALSNAACGDTDAEGTPGGANDVILRGDDFTEYYTDDGDGDDGKTFRFATYEIDYSDGTHCRVVANGPAVDQDCDLQPPG